MRIITVKIPESYLEGLEELVNTGRYTSRSEAIRAAIRELLRRELWDIHGERKSENSENDDYGYIDKKGKIIKLSL
ncbi:MAG: ribbon-helix-helix domain-containing protein [Sulfolobales archaeon]